MLMDGAVTDIRLNRAVFIIDNEYTHSVSPSQNKGCIKKIQEIKHKYDSTKITTKSVNCEVDKDGY